MKNIFLAFILAILSVSQGYAYTDSLPTDDTSHAATRTVSAAEVDKRIGYINVKSSKYGAVGDGVADDTAALQAALDAAEAMTPPGQVFLPAGKYKITDVFDRITKPISIHGAGASQSIIMPTTDVSGTIFEFSDTWVGLDYPPDGNSITFPQEAGVRIKGISIVGDRSTSNVQDGISFVDRNDHFIVDDVSLLYLKGTCLSFGKAGATTSGFAREGFISDLHVRNCGNGSNYPAIRITSAAAGAGEDTTNELYFKNIKVIFPYGRGIEITQPGSATKRIGLIKFSGVQLHGVQDISGSPSSFTYDLLYIGDKVSDVYIDQLTTNASYDGYYAIKLDGTNTTDAPYGIHIQGELGVGYAIANGQPNDSGGGINIQYGRQIFLDFTSIATIQTDLTMGANAGLVFLRDQGGLANWTYSINSAAAGNLYRYGNAGVAQVPDSTASGGNARGTSAVDLQRSRGAASQVASGANSVIVGGVNNTASGTRSAALSGANNAVSGTDAVQIGGNSSTINAALQTGLGGSGANGRSTYGKMVWASGIFSTQGDAQAAWHLLRAITTNATATRLTSDASGASTANSITLPNNGAYRFRGMAIAYEPATGDVKEWEIDGLIKRGASAATTALVGSPTVTSAYADAGAAAWALAVTADTGNGSIAVTGTGEASHTIHWVVKIETLEVL